MNNEEALYRKIKKADKLGHTVKLIVRRYVPHPDKGVVPLIEPFKKSAYWKDGNWHMLDGYSVPHEKKDILGIAN